jgi:hypothetical protein
MQGGLAGLGGYTCPFRVRVGSLESSLHINYHAMIINGVCQGELRIDGVEKEMHRAADGPHAPNSNQHRQAKLSGKKTRTASCY